MTTIRTGNLLISIEHSIEQMGDQELAGTPAILFICPNGESKPVALCDPLHRLTPADNDDTAASRDGLGPEQADGAEKAFSFSAFICGRRKELGLTQLQLAHAVGLKTGEAVSLIERGKRRIDLKRVPKLADARRTARSWSGWRWKNTAPPC